VRGGYTTVLITCRLVAGQYVCIELEEVPLLAVHRLQQYGFLLCYSLFAHEQKLSVLHFHVTKYPAYTEPLKSKDELLFMVSAVHVRGARPCSPDIVCAIAVAADRVQVVYDEAGVQRVQPELRQAQVRALPTGTWSKPRHAFEPSLTSACSCLHSPTGSAWPAATARPACPPARCWSSSARPTPGTRRASGPPAAAAGASLPLAAWPTSSPTGSCSRRY
jgi:hypothetical protein